MALSTTFRTSFSCSTGACVLSTPCRHAPQRVRRTGSRNIKWVCCLSLSVLTLEFQEHATIGLFSSRSNARCWEMTRVAYGNFFVAARCEIISWSTMPEDWVRDLETSQQQLMIAWCVFTHKTENSEGAGIQQRRIHQSLDSLHTARRSEKIDKFS